nr:hypothetical protein [Acinetobacter sp. Marseille-Q1620]
MNLEQSVQKLNLVFMPYELKAFTHPVSTPEEISELQRVSKHALPPELLRFYKEIGGVGYEDIGCHDTGMSIRLLPVSILIPALQETHKLMHLHSLGIIDWLRYQLGNSWSKLDRQTPELLDINQRYIGLGMRQFDHDFARHIFVDEHGKFGIIDFHSEDYKSLWRNFLSHMLESSTANMTLEQALTELLENNTVSHSHVTM